jgi:hypothetical protein
VILYIRWLEKKAKEEAEAVVTAMDEARAEMRQWYRAFFFYFFINDHDYHSRFRFELSQSGKEMRMNKGNKN